MGEGSTERAVATHTLAQEAWAFARPSEIITRFELERARARTLLFLGRTGARPLAS